MNFYLNLLDNCINYFGSDHENAERYISWILDNISKDIKQRKISEDEYDRFMDIVSDLF